MGLHTALKSLSARCLIHRGAQPAELMIKRAMGKIGIRC